MMRAVFGFALTASSVTVLAWLMVRRRRVVAAFGGVDLAAALIGFGVVANLAPLAGVKLSSPVIGLALLGLLCWAGISWFRHGKPHAFGPADTWLRLSWQMMAAILAWCVAVDILVGPGIYGLRPVAYVSAGLLWVVLGLIVSTRAISTLAVAYWGLVILAVLTVPAAFPVDVWRGCTTGALEKCSLADGLFKSVYDSENYIAILASVTVIASLSAMRRFELLAAASFCILIIVATGSRTSLLAIAVAAVWRLVGLIIERRGQIYRVPAIVCVGLPVVGISAATFVMFAADRTTLSNRGNIWIAAREYLGGQVFSGVGVSKWYLLRDLGSAPDHFFHSGYVLMIFSGGLISLVLWALWMTALLYSRIGDGRAVTAKAPVVLLLVYSLTEVIWNPLSVDGLSWIVMALVLTQTVQPADQGERAAGQSGATLPVPSTSPSSTFSAGAQ